MVFLELVFCCSFKVTFGTMNHNTHVYNPDVAIKLPFKGKCLATLITNKRLLQMITQFMSSKEFSCNACVITQVTFELLLFGFVMVVNVVIISTQGLEIFPTL